jgi:SAM-dependent methyltransferase
MSLLAKGIFTSLIIFGSGSYLSFKYNEFTRYDETLKAVQSQGKLRSFLHEIHQKSQDIKEEVLPNTSLPKENYYRKVLLSYAEGIVLEPGVGLSDNQKFYPSTIGKVIAIDWVKKCIEYGFINNKEAKRQYLLDDCENMSFEDNTFDCVADVLGLQYYSNPEKVLREMKRVCKENGKILILAKGQSFYSWFNKYLDLVNAKYVCRYGIYINRDWNEIISKAGFEVMKCERKINGTLYFYILKNKK